MRIEILAALAAGLSPVQLLGPSPKDSRPRSDWSTRAVEPDQASRRRRWMEARQATPADK